VLHKCKRKSILIYDLFVYVKKNDCDNKLERKNRKKVTEEERKREEKNKRYNYNLYSIYMYNNKEICIF